MRCAGSALRRGVLQLIRNVAVAKRRTEIFPDECLLLMLLTAPYTGTSVPWLWGAVNAPTNTEAPIMQTVAGSWPGTDPMRQAGGWMRFLALVQR